MAIASRICCSIWLICRLITSSTSFFFALGASGINLKDGMAAWMKRTIAVWIFRCIRADVAVPDNAKICFAIPSRRAKFSNIRCRSDAQAICSGLVDDLPSKLASMRRDLNIDTRSLMSLLSLSSSYVN